MSDQVQELLEVPSEFVKDGVQFVRRCTKPDQQEFLRLCQAVGVGFLIMGAVGYVVKLGMSSTTTQCDSTLTQLQCISPSTTLSWAAHKRPTDGWKSDGGDSTIIPN
ncbi:hypothetical protein FSOLCH5_004647 [Fusarium solani]